MLLREILQEQFSGVQRPLADALGISPSRLGRVLGGEFSLSVLSCLRLAKISGRKASEVLAAADKEDIAELLGELYGEATTPISEADKELLDRWHRLRPGPRETMDGLINELLNRSQQRIAVPSRRRLKSVG